MMKVHQHQQQQHSLFSQGSWGRLEMKPKKKQRSNDKKFIRKKNPAFHLSGDGAQHFDQATLSNNGRLD